MVLLASGLTGGAPAVRAQPGVADVVDPADRRIGVGLRRMAGIGDLGAGVVLPASPRLSADLNLFGVYERGARGAVLAPAIRLSLFSGERSSPYLGAGLQVARVAFGQVTGNGYGGFFSFGYDWRLRAGIGVELGLGFQGRGDIAGQKGVVSVARVSTFAPYYDVALRYWF